MKFTYSIPTKILFGPGSFNDLATTPLPGKKALVVITAGKSMRANGYLDRLIDMLDKQGIGHALFDKILPNPVLRHVHEGAALAREQGCDFVIGLGGGSSIDSAKSIAVMAKNPGDYWDYISGGSGKGQPLVNGALPIVAIATTAGHGHGSRPVDCHHQRGHQREDRLRLRGNLPRALRGGPGNDADHPGAPDRLSGL